MKFTKQDLLTLLIGLFLFASCKNTNTLGFDPDPAFAIKGTLEDGVTVSTTTVPDEATSTIAMPRHPLGYINEDPIFGTTEANLVMAVTLPAQTYYSFGTNAEIDSAVLVLPYSTQFYGDTTTSVYSFNVQQLKDNLSLQKSFMSNREWPVETPILGNFTAKIQPKTPTKITDIVTNGPDTLRTVVPQLRIKLNNAFIQENIIDLDSAQRSSNNKFANAFKGLQVNVNRAGVSGKGGIIFFGFAGTDANVEIYYKKQNATSSSSTDTVAVRFPISVSTGPVAATIKHDYTGTPLKAQLDVPTPTTPYEVTYLQALAGVRNKVSFPDLKDFVTRVKAGNTKARVLVNRAELVVNVNSGTDVAPFTAAQRLSLYRLDIAGQRSNIVDNIPPTPNSAQPRYAGSEAAFGGFYDSVEKRYIFTMTAYIQDLIDGNTEDYGTYIAPSSLTEFNLNSSVTSAGRSVINTQSVTGGQKGIKLNIYYTVISE